MIVFGDGYDLIPIIASISSIDLHVAPASYLVGWTVPVDSLLRSLLSTKHQISTQASYLGLKTANYTREMGESPIVSFRVLPKSLYTISSNSSITLPSLTYPTLHFRNLCDALKGLHTLYILIGKLQEILLMRVCVSFKCFPIVSPTQLPSTSHYFS